MNAREPEHLEEHIHGPIEDFRAREKMFGRLAGDELCLRPKHHRLRADDACLAIGSDHGSPAPRRSKAKLDHRGRAAITPGLRQPKGVAEDYWIDRNVVLQHQRGVEPAIDDLAPGLAMRQETGDLRRT